MVLLSLSNSHLFWQGKEPEPIEAHHRAAFLAYPRDPAEPIHKAHARLRQLVQDANAAPSEQNPLSKIFELREPVRYQSFWNHGESREAIPVVPKRSFATPEISDELFTRHGFWTAEHDISYTERASADLAAEKGWWLLDSKGHPAKLNVLTYDIETTQYGKGSRDIPIDMIGYAEFGVEYEAHKDLETEAFDFRFRHLPNDWAEREVTQLVSRNRNEELDHLMQFTQHAVKYDIIAGHNILGFDNKQVHDRIVDALRQNEKNDNLSPRMKEWFLRFTNVYSRPDSSFHFGTKQEIAMWHPMSLDTFHAARKFYFYHDDFTLKGLAPWLGVEVPDRVYLEPHEMALDAKTMLYNKHDIQEQLGVTQALIAQALPLCFTTNMALDALLTGGTTKMWDHMALIRARRARRIMPATSRAQGVARAIHRLLPTKPFPTREEISQAVLDLPAEERHFSTNKEILRVAKQGPEMPFWCEHPGVIVRNTNAAARAQMLRERIQELRTQGTEAPTDSAGDDASVANLQREVRELDEAAAAGEDAPAEEGSDAYGYAIPGGMTLKPDSDLKSHFVPWYQVVAADVGAMYPTILKARNLTADTVQPCRVGEKPDDWIWLFELDDTFARSGKYLVKKAEADDPFTKGKGWLIAVKHRKEDGLVNLAMTGIMSQIQKVKTARSKAKKDNAPKDVIRIHDMTYQSLKAARNAGTHGILVAVNVSCRQFNVWGGANITTIGQRILHDALVDFEAQGIRVVYGDTDGIYLACSKSAGNLPHFAAALGADVEPETNKWITMPAKAMDAIAGANRKFRDQLQYEGFELEAETHDAMVFIVHKNYLIFDANPEGTGIVLETKGNNFKASDKAPLTHNVLRDIMAKSLKDVASWDDEEAARESMKVAIKKATKEVMATVQISKIAQNQLILRQSVSPIKSYAPNPDNTLRHQAVRTAALEDVLGEAVTATRKFKFIVCKDPMPLYKEEARAQAKKEELARQGHNLVVKLPKTRGLKPIEYMWPLELVKPTMIDWGWYKSMVEDYVKGAFGFDSLELATQRDLSSWF